MAFSLIAMLLCAVVLSSDRLLSLLFGRSTQSSSTAVIGEISLTENDTRHRSHDSYSWRKANAREHIRIGDSVFTGENSQSQVRLASGAVVDLDQNSLVKFSRIDNIEVPNLSLGNFRVAVNGTVKIAVAGRITEIAGKGSVVQVTVDQQKPELRVLKGEAQITTQEASTKLEVEETMTLDEPEVREAPIAREIKIIPQPIPETLVYINTLDDLYEYESSTKIVKREQRRTLVDLPVKVSWATEGTTTQVFGQLSESPLFLNIPDSFIARGEESSGSFRRVFLGKNIYRLSADGKIWTDPKEFEVIASFLNKPAPRILPDRQRVYLTQDSASISGRIETEFPHVVLEISTSPFFSGTETQTLFSRDKTFRLKTTEAKPLFLRARGVAHNFQITSASEFIRINVEEEPLPVSPSTVPLSQEDQDGALESNSKVERQPASTPALHDKISSESLFRNNGYSSSKLSFVTSAFTMYSKEQIQSGQKNPTSVMAGVKWMSWLRSHGLEMSFLTKVADIQSTSNTNTNPLQIEARYHYRWTLPFNPFSKLNQSQVSIIGGYEYYQNSKSQFFSPGYQLFKGGLNLTFPLLYRWDTGGEFLYGQGLESSQKYEISGHLNYYWNSAWSLGLGYRMHLFKAGSSGASPLGLPYREGFGEGYSVIRWHY